MLGSFPPKSSGAADLDTATGTLDNSKLENSGASAGTFNNATVTVNLQGIVTDISEGAGGSAPAYLFGEMPFVPAIAEPLSITARTNAFTAPIQTNNSATGIVFDGTNLWFSKSTANITKRNIASGVETTVTLDHAGKAIFVPGTPSFIYVLKTNGNSVYKVNTSTNAVTTIALTALGTALCHLGLYVWITAGTRLLKVSISTNAVQTTFPPLSVNSCVSDGSKVWLTAVSGEIYGYLAASTAPDDTFACTGDQPTDYPQRITYDGQFLYVAKSISGDIDVFHRQSGTVLATIPSPSPLVEPPDLYFDGVNVVAKSAVGLQKLSVESRTFTDLYPVHGAVRDAVTDGTHLWIVYQDAVSGFNLIDKFRLNTTYAAVPLTSIVLDMNALPGGIFNTTESTPELIIATDGSGQIRLQESITFNSTKRLWIENISGDSLSVLPQGADTFDDLSGSIALADGQSVLVQSDAARAVWHIVNRPLNLSTKFATNRIGSQTTVGAGSYTPINFLPFLSCHTGAIIDLPDVSVNQDGYLFFICAENDGIVVNGFSGQTIGGQASITLNTNETLLIVGNQNVNQWDILGRNTVFPVPVTSGGTGLTYSNVTGGYLTSDGAGGYFIQSYVPRTFAVAIDGSGSPISTGIQGADLLIPFNCNISKVTLLSDVSGSIEIDIWAADYSAYPPTIANTIVAAAPPAIVTGLKSQDGTLTGWSVFVAANSTLRFNVNSCTDITKCTLILEVAAT